MPGHQRQTSPNTRIPLHFYFIAGGAGDLTACLFSHPLDTLKVRSQLKGELSCIKHKQGLRAMFQDAITIVNKEGFFSGLYNGISASCLRQSTFSTLRHGGYATLCLYLGQQYNNNNNNNNNTNLINDKKRPPHPSSNLSLMTKITCGIIAGGSAALISNPSDVVLIRMQADNHWPKHQRRGYSNAFNGIKKIIQHEKIKSLWIGCTPNILRATLITSTQIPSYYFAKQSFSKLLNLKQNDFSLHFISSLFSATAASLVTAPVDVVKTRLVNMKKQQQQNLKNDNIIHNNVKNISSTTSSAVMNNKNIVYNGPIDCIVKILKIEGICGLYKGLVPTLVRLTPHTVILWIVQENLIEFIWNNY